MKIIAFDLGANLAYATNCCQDNIGTRVCIGDRRKRAEAALWWFEDCILYAKDNGLECVIYERPFARGEHATRALWGLAGILEAVAMKYGFTALDVPPLSIKKWITGNAHAGKELMMIRAKELGYIGDNEHEADAFCLLKYAEANVVEGNG